jgi:hypothetical protein
MPRNNRKRVVEGCCAGVLLRVLGDSIDLALSGFGLTLLERALLPLPARAQIFRYFSAISETRLSNVASKPNGVVELARVHRCGESS